eukprot:2890207-Alexandrium_andersonii.AAC.1
MSFRSRENQRALCRARPCLHVLQWPSSLWMKKRATQCEAMFVVCRRRQESVAHCSRHGSPVSRSPVKCEAMLLIVWLEVARTLVPSYAHAKC